METTHPLDLDPHGFATMYPCVSDECSPLRKLALAVLKQAIYQATHPHVLDQQRHTARVNGVAANPVEWLSRWDLVEPWCRVAEIPVARMRRRIEEVVGAGEATRLAA